MPDPSTGTRVVLAIPNESLASTLETHLAGLDSIEAILHVETPEALRTALEGFQQRSSPRASIVVLDLETTGAFEVLEERAGTGNRGGIPFFALVEEGAHEQVRRAYELYANVCLERQGTPGPIVEAVVKAVRFWTRWTQLPHA